MTDPTINIMDRLVDKKGLYMKFIQFTQAFKFFLKVPTLSEQLAHSAVDLRLKEISEFLHGSEIIKNPTLP